MLVFILGGDGFCGWPTAHLTITAAVVFLAITESVILTRMVVLSSRKSVAGS